MKEIFGHFGPIKKVCRRALRDGYRFLFHSIDFIKVDLQVDPKLNISKGFAYIEYENADDANKGQQYMDGGQIDGNKIRVTYVLVTSNRARHSSPGKRFK